MKRVAAGVLAGGKSNRMGKNKASLQWRGSTFLETVLEACRDFEERYVSVDEKAKYPHLTVPLVEDEKKEYGPLEGIYQILSIMEAEYVLILATDMPMVSRELLLDMAALLTGEEDCLVLRLGGRPQPMCSIYSKRVLPIVRDMRENGEHKPGLLFQKVRCSYVDLETLPYGKEIIDNINTPGEYAEICQKAEKRLEDFAPFVKQRLEMGPVMVCYLDGLGYCMYKKALQNGRIPFMESHFQVVPVKTVYPPVTNPAMATILTGVSPKIHGVRSRKDRMLRTSTIFKGRNRENTAFLEGDTRILSTELSPILHTARQEKGCDYWIFRSAKQAVQERTELIFAHFHEIDDAAHMFGPYGKETMEKLEETDGYIRELSENYLGTFLLISDHGVHQEENGGSHGEWKNTADSSKEAGKREEDMLAVWGMRNEDYDRE